MSSSHGTVDKANQRYDIPDEKLDSWKKAVEEFQAHKIKVERHKLRVDDLEGVPLTPAEVAALEPVLEGLGDGKKD